MDANWLYDALGAAALVAVGARAYLHFKRKAPPNDAKKASQPIPNIGVFRVLKQFEMTRGRDRSFFNTGDGPLLGQYHPGHDYQITHINKDAVQDAVDAGYAAIIEKPRGAA